MKLHDEIQIFLDNHANVSPNAHPDDEHGKYSYPYASMLSIAASQIEAGVTPIRVHSSWESGGYSPYTDREARARHDQLVARVNKLAKE